MCLNLIGENDKGVTFTIQRERRRKYNVLEKREEEKDCEMGESEKRETDKDSKKYAWEKPVQVLKDGSIADITIIKKLWSVS